MLRHNLQRWAWLTTLTYNFKYNICMLSQSRIHWNLWIKTIDQGTLALMVAYIWLLPWWWHIYGSCPDGGIYMALALMVAYIYMALALMVAYNLAMLLGNACGVSWCYHWLVSLVNHSSRWGRQPGERGQGGACWWASSLGCAEMARGCRGLCYLLQAPRSTGHDGFLYKVGAIGRKCGMFAF